MSDDEFDPSAAAAAATGDLADTDPGDLEDAPDPDDATGAGGDPGEGGEAPDAAGESSSTSSGVVATWLLPLLTASEAGPTAATLEEHGIGGWLAHVVDGVIDYVLHFAGDLGDELDDSLGPLGKVGRGLWARADDVDQGGDGASASENQGDGGDEDVDVDVDGVEGV